MNKNQWIKVEADFQKPHAEGPSPLQKIIDSHLKLRKRDQKYVDPSQVAFWTPEFFNLHKSELFEKITEDQRQQILNLCSRNLINEAYFIEKSALAYCAKMILLAETTEIAQVYSLISSDEATHLQWVSPYISEEDRIKPVGSFLSFLGGIVEGCEPNSLTYLVQIILEGWGLKYYQSLGNNCQDEALSKVFLDIVRDEALHHYSGEVMFDVHQLSKEQGEFIRYCLATYTKLIRVGPQATVASVETVVGGLNKQQKIKLFEDLETVATSQKKLDIMKGLMLTPGLEKTVSELEEKGLFTPCKPEDCQKQSGSSASLLPHPKSGADL